ncbi:phosphocholine-specific phospholipase C [Compostibacter hankyongensis]|uniref:phospholipase C n=1 Tax=Compostibacter hankyongensis TaxID=1007089 RepID=A0ABP8FCB8_9BACT
MGHYNRRDFLKNAAILSGAAGLSSMLPASVRRAMAIQADPGTTFYDAEHIVLLMQENRSFDHLFGTLKGVRGFNDPRSRLLPDGDKVWIQKDKDGNAHAPFHIDLHKTKITWQGGLAHSWPDQSAARNQGKYDNWIPAKTTMTMGFYDRSDVPFYYALADAFTICDHNFCSSLTGTTPNRLFFWTGNIRPRPDGRSRAAVLNSMAESRDDVYVDWYTFPELLEDHGISWKIYQNELWSADLQGEGIDYWLGNYGDNAIEYVKRHRVKLSAYFRKNGDHTVKPALSPQEVQARYDKLSEKEKNLVDKAFTTNIDDAGDYLKLAPYTFRDDRGMSQTVQIPRNDIFRKFRDDVNNGTLPAVSWLVAPQSFSDHTSTPLYGTWYVSEALDILTRNPEVWKKTIFILNYDENDGYFDHLPPFVPPKPGEASSGKVSAGIDTASDYESASDAPIGLGYRVPMIIASPWSRGGYVNSQVFDHTSTLMFLEKFLKKKTGREIVCPNISSWRRAVCGDLTSAFRPFRGEKIPLPGFEDRETVITDIQNARNKPAQETPTPLSREEIEKINKHAAFSEGSSSWMPQQEKGTRPACALPYRLYADAGLDESRSRIRVRFEAAGPEAGSGGAGAAFNVYTPASYDGVRGKTWAYATEAGRHVEDALELDRFPEGRYDLRVHGPNGFFRGFRGDRQDPALDIRCTYEQKTGGQSPNGNILLLLENRGAESLRITVTDNAYGTPLRTIRLPPHSNHTATVDLKGSAGWYDLSLHADGHAVFGRHYAGHVETGRESITDPYMGGVM